MSGKYAITVPSYGRVETILEKGYTIETLASTGEEVFVFVRKEECEAYARVAKKYGCIIVELPEFATNMATTRDAMLMWAEHNNIEYLYMFDDDCKFAYRETVPGRLLNSTSKEVADMLLALRENCNEKYPLVGPRIRAFANGAKELIQINSRIIFGWCLHLPTIWENNWKYDWAGKTMSDFHMQLTILSAGYDTKTLNNYTLDSIGKEGGCFTYRTSDMQSESAMLLEKEFPHCVDLRVKEDKYGEPYYDVTIRFSKARRQ